MTHIKAHTTSGPVPSPIYIHFCCCISNSFATPFKMLCFATPFKMLPQVGNHWYVLYISIYKLLQRRNFTISRESYSVYTRTIYNLTPIFFSMPKFSFRLLYLLSSFKRFAGLTIREMHYKAYDFQICPYTKLCKIILKFTRSASETIKP